MAKMIRVCCYSHKFFFLFRDNIETNYSSDVAQIREQYSKEDNDIVEKFLIAKKSLKHETNVANLNDQKSTQKEATDQAALSGNCE